MHIPLRLSSVLAITASYFVSDAPAGIPAYHYGSAIMHDSDYNNCIGATGRYHDPQPGALAVIDRCFVPPYGPGIWTWHDGATIVTTLGGSENCLDVGNHPKKGNKATVEICRPGAAGQQWVYKPDTKVFVVAGYDLCLNLPNNNVKPGTQLDITTCNEEDPAQYWPAHDFE